MKINKNLLTQYCYESVVSVACKDKATVGPKRVRPLADFDKK
jgi:hypothetical protein